MKIESVADCDNSGIWCFDGFRVERATRRLLDHDDREIVLTSRVFDVLLLLLEHHGQLLAKQTMMAALWPGRMVEENNLTQAISALRRALRHDRHTHQHQHILTVSGRGYRFVAPIKREPAHRVEQNTPTGTTNIQAHRLYLTGRHHMDKARSDEFAIATTHFRQAIELDPVYALAWAALGEVYRRAPLVGDAAPLEAFPLARAAAQKALIIEPQLALAHATLGWVAFWHEWDWAASEAHFRRAITLEPELVEAHIGLAHLLTNLGRYEQAASSTQLAMQLEPFSPIVNTIAASFRGAAGHTEEARMRLDKVINDMPGFWVALLHRAELAIACGDDVHALDDLQRANTSSAGSMQVLGLLGFALARCGDNEGARALLENIHARESASFVPPSSIAMIHAGLGDYDLALDQLERALSLRDVRLTFLKRDSAWQAIRNQPRFITLTKSLALA